MESAFSFLASCVTSSVEKPSLEPSIFGDAGPRAGELVQISGDCGSGKSLLQLELIARIILPRNCGGHETGAVFIDCESSFNRAVLCSVMEKYILNLADPTVAAGLTPQHIATIQRSALHRLLLIRCFSLEQYELSLLALPEHFVKSEQMFDYVLVDSLATFYWTKCTEKNLVRMDTFLRAQCKALRKLAEKWKKVVIFTKPAYFGSGSTWRDFESTATLGGGSPLEGSATQISTQAGSNSRHRSVLNELASAASTPIPVDHRIELSEIDHPSPRSSGGNEGDDEQRFSAFITTKDKQFVRFYLIDSFGFNWIEHTNRSQQ